MKELWNKLDRQKRFALLTKADPEKSWNIRTYEMKLKWDKLLPSTQQSLERLAAQ
jgi:hypothetical protein